MLVYILQVIFFQLLFLLVFELLLKKETFFTYNRWYLLFCSVISFLLPLLRIETFSTLVPAESIAVFTNVWLPEVFIGNTPENIQYLPAVEIKSATAIINWWLVAYGVGVLGSLFLLFRKYQNLSRLFSFITISEQKGFKVIEVPDSTIACTFYQTIFLGDKLSEEEKQQILSHELVHVKQKHSLDLIFFEVLKIIFWFNPMVYIYQSRISTLHEFIADAAVVKTTGKRSYYEQLLNSAFNTRNISFINQFFNHSLIKKRIVMLQKSKSKTIAKFKYLVILPLMLVMLTYVACSDEIDPTVETTLGVGDQDAVSKAALWEEITDMQAKGATFQEITDAFFIEKDAHIKSKEAYFRFQTFTRMIHENSVKKKKEAGTYDENSKNPFQSLLDQDYDAYVASKKNKPFVEKRSPEHGDDKGVPFAVIEQVPVFPGCENLSSNDEQKKCMSEKIQDYVNKNFNTSLGKELNLSGVNRIIVQFKIDKQGNIAEVRSRAPHPDLEIEAERVINSLPSMEPGKQGGVEVGVMYSLPIVFQVGE